MAMNKDRIAAQHTQLVEFFRSPEGATLGQEGDDALRTPVQQAIHSMRELLKIRAGIERTRKRGKIGAAVLEKCHEGHDYYRVSDTVPTRCPICLAIELDKMRSQLANARQKVGAAWADLK